MTFFSKEILQDIAKAVQPLLPEYVEHPCPKAQSSADPSQCNEAIGYVKKDLSDHSKLWEAPRSAIRASHTSEYVTGDLASTVFRAMRADMYSQKQMIGMMFHTHTTHLKDYRNSMVPSHTDIMSAIHEALARSRCEYDLIVSRSGVSIYRVQPAFLKWLQNELMENYFKEFPHLLGTGRYPLRFDQFMECERNRDLFEVLEENSNAMHMMASAPLERIHEMDPQAPVIYTPEEYAQRARNLLDPEDDDPRIQMGVDFMYVPYQ